MIAHAVGPGPVRSDCPVVMPSENAIPQVQSQWITVDFRWVIIHIIRPGLSPVGSSFVEFINRHTYTYGIWEQPGEGIGVCMGTCKEGPTQNTTDTAKKGGELLP